MRIDRQAIWDIVGDESRFIFDSIPPEYLTDALGRLCGAAEALVFPLSAQEVSGILRYAHEHRVPVTPGGRGRTWWGPPCLSREVSSWISAA